VGGVAVRSFSKPRHPFLALFVDRYREEFGVDPICAKLPVTLST